jgi:hypothetical protein
MKPPLLFLLLTLRPDLPPASDCQRWEDCTRPGRGIYTTPDDQALRCRAWLKHLRHGRALHGYQDGRWDAWIGQVEFSEQFWWHLQAVRTSADGHPTRVALALLRDHLRTRRGADLYLEGWAPPLLQPVPPLCPPRPELPAPWGANAR